MGFDLDAELGGRRSSIGRLEGARPPRARTTAAQDRYLDAYKQYIYSGDLNQVHGIVNECVAMDPSEPTFHLMEGILRAMLGNFRGALSSVDRALELEPIEQKKSVELLWKARILDLMERRADAASIFGELSDDESTPRCVSRGSDKARRRAFKEKDRTGILLDFTNGDTME